MPLMSLMSLMSLPGTAPNLDNTPNTVFLNGWQPDPEGQPDTFVAYYGAADSVVGAVLIQATKE